MEELSRSAHGVLMAPFQGPSMPRWLENRIAGGLGSVCLFGSNIESPEQVAALTSALHAASPGLLIATDEEGGDVTRLHMSSGSPFPGNAALGSADDESLTSRVAHAIGRELTTAGVDLDLAPVVDVNSNPDNPVIGVRSFGADPELVARHARAYIRGLQSAGVGACAKHFPGHGDTSVDSHLDLATIDAPRDVLLARELLPFRAAVEADAVAVMTAHIRVPSIDGSAPATLSPTVLDALRTELRFRGLIVSDALDMKGVSAGRGIPAAAVLALAAGADLLCLAGEGDDALVDAVVTAIVRTVKDGELSESRLAEAAARTASASRRIASLRDATAVGHDDERLGIEAAARAIQVIGVLPELRAPLVVRVRTGTSPAVGDVPWGLPVDGLIRRDGSQLDVEASAPVDALLKRASGRPLVVLVRDGHRHGDVLDLLARLAAVRPDLVAVEMGWPGGKLPGAATVMTYGASRASGAALDAVLAGGSSG